MNGNGKHGWAEFSEINAAYMADLYDKYTVDPGSVDPESRSFFERFGPPEVAATAVAPPDAAPSVDVRRVAAAIALATAIRMYGHHAARLDPLGREPLGDASLLPETHSLSEQDLASLPPSVVGGEAARDTSNSAEAIKKLRVFYQGTTGYEFEHISDSEERDWLFGAVESGRFLPPRNPIDHAVLLDRLSQVEGFERFLQSAFPTQTRFSLEGLDLLVPMLDELVDLAAAVGTRTMVLGMAHRGRLNVLAHVLGQPYEEIFAQFQGALPYPDDSATGSIDVGWTGDVKYHLGAGIAVNGTSDREAMRVVMPPNPSHLEFVDPVVEGMTRAASERRGQPGPARLDEVAALAVLIHGDAAFPGEGVVAETLNMSRLPGYRAGGTVHIIANNQLGFTTAPEMSRSTLFASDLAKGFEIPIVHVNADDADACIAAIRLAHAYLHRFRKDVLVDLIGYRRHGHNEGDEPSFTQPKMYDIISKHPTARAVLAEAMASRGEIAADEPARMLKEVTDHLQEVRRTLTRDAVEEAGKGLDQAGLEAGGAIGGLGHEGVAAEIETRVPAEVLRRLNDELLSLPSGFSLHSKLKPVFERRRTGLASEGGDGQGKVDWAHAETLAFATIVADGTPIRITGEDTARGTFSQRHLILKDVATDSAYVPLQSIPSARASFDVWDSPLTEQATLGFEFGFNVQAPEALVLWEAQYGDFVNAGQVIIDAFMSSARSKWAQDPSLVLLLPHAYEGQGPEHSSARLERFLQLAAEDNLRVANCTTAAQYFHILRRQKELLSRDPRPLVLMTPKSLLRHPLASSSMEELATGRFMPVIDDAQAHERTADITRLVLCSGHVFADLMVARQAMERESGAALPVAVVRVEELYPFPADQLRAVIEGYPALKEIVWAQEEPRNMGAWTFVAPRLRDMTGGRLPLYYAGRTRRASPAEGASGWHTREQKRLVEAAFAPAPEAAQVLQKPEVSLTQPPRER